ncbi:MAG: hypothetical protein K9H64_18645 [Bacteroidales bacterium]|nr:hypothetical protein [Bacteroidales bacterium]MCF8458030.1 hypothetical protein [Bacteroidales bacterium]
MKQKFRNNTALLFILLITFFPGIAWTQQQRPQGPPPVPNEKQIDKIVNDLAEKLALTSEQSETISKLYIAHFKEVKEKQEKDREAREANHQAMEKLRKDFEKDVKAVLTKDQQKQFDDFVKEHEKNTKNPRQGRGKR